MAANTKVYNTSGDELVVASGGKLTVKEGATVTGLAAIPLTAATADELGCVKVGTGLSVNASGVLSAVAHVAANQADSTATTVAGLKDDLNTLLAAMKTAGLMEADAAADT